LPRLETRHTFKKGIQPTRDLSHQPVISLLVRSEGQALLATPFRNIQRIEMPEMRSAPAPKRVPTKPSPMPDETARLFQLALHDVVRSSAVSMAELRDSVKACASILRDTDVGPAQMIITIKACAKEGTRRYPQILNEHELSNADFLMEQIIKWAIVEYYSAA
jgi:hypothetical protein